MIRVTPFAVFILLLIGCSNPSHRPSEYADMDKMAASASNGVMESEIELGEPPINHNQSLSQQKIIKEGYISFESNDLLDTRQHVDSVLNHTGGYISSEREYTVSNRISQSLNVRVPIKRFDEFVEKLSQGVGTFDDKSISSRDVTTEYIDVAARTKTKKELEQRYLALLQKAQSVSEILEIERELNTVRADIESMESRLRYLTDQTDYSTLEITYYKNIAKKTAFSSKFSRGFVNGWNNLIWFFVGVVNIWPFVVLVPLITVITLRWLRVRRAKHRNKTQ